MKYSMILTLDCAFVLGAPPSFSSFFSLEIPQVINSKHDMREYVCIILFFELINFVIYSLMFSTNLSLVVFCNDLQRMERPNCFNAIFIRSEYTL